MSSYYDYNWSCTDSSPLVERTKRRKTQNGNYTEIQDTDNTSIDTNKVEVLQSENVYIYSIGNEIHFSSPITLESIQKIIMEIQKIIITHLKKSKNEKLVISITIDSPGGSVLSVLKYVDFINIVKKKYKNIEFVSIITGLAASAGTIMALCAHKCYMTSNAYAMIHELSSGNAGTFTFLTSHMEFINKLHDKLVAIYVIATGKNKTEIENLMKNETWFSAEEYKKIGFVSEII
jgi:ATP-dependent protease ClpP protease subunit